MNGEGAREAGKRMDDLGQRRKQRRAKEEEWGGGGGFGWNGGLKRYGGPR